MLIPDHSIDQLCRAQLFVYSTCSYDSHFDSCFVFVLIVIERVFHFANRICRRCQPVFRVCWPRYWANRRYRPRRCRWSCCRRILYRMVLRKSLDLPDGHLLTNSGNTLSESIPTRHLGPNSTTMSPLTLRITKSRTIPTMTSMVNRKLPSLAPGEHLL
jgi:hypothetical protein